MIINKNLWGKHLWLALHYISIGYPNNPSDNDKQNYKNFFLLLKDVLPCKICSLHYEKNLEKLPLTDEILNNKESFIKWVIDLHNDVNQMLGKKIINYDDAINILSNNNIKDDNNIKDNNNTIFFIILFILFLIIIIKKLIYI